METIRFIVDQFFSPDDLKQLRDSYPEWILVAISAIIATFILIDPFHVLWQ